MKLVEFNWNPTNRQLRQFGVICLFALPLLGWLWNGGPHTLIILAVVGFIIAGASMVLPATMKPVFIALMIAATPIGMVLSELAMLLIYYAVFLPIGLAFRLARRDALHMKLDRNKDTYWQPVDTLRDVASYYRQS